jgi:hypothetical protein
VPSVSSVPNHAKDILLFVKFSDFVIWFENRSGKEETREEDALKLNKKGVRKNLGDALRFKNLSWLEVRKMFSETSL